MNTIVAPRAVAALEISDLSFSYPDGWQALKGVSFSVQPGEKVAILGPNGAGKSTLMLHLNGLLHGDGDVSVMGHHVVENDKKALARIRAMVGLVFQDPDDQLFSPTVYDDVAFGPLYMGLPQEEIDDRVRARPQPGRTGRLRGQDAVPPQRRREEARGHSDSSLYAAPRCSCWMSRRQD